MEERTDNTSKDMDLMDLLRLCKKCAKKCKEILKNATISLLRVNLKYWYVILAFIIAGVCVLFAVKSDQRQNADFYLRTFLVPAKRAIDNTNALNNDIDNEGNAKLAKALGLSKNEVKGVKSISACAVQDFDRDECPDADIAAVTDTSCITMKYALHVSISAEGKCNFEKIKDAIIAYNNNNKLIAETSKYNYETQLYELAGYEEQIREIDSARAKIASSGKFSVDNSGDKMQFNGDPYSAKELQDLIETCARIKFALTSQRTPVEAVSPINLTSTASSKKTAAMIIILFYLGGLIVAYIIKNRKAIKEAIKEN